MAQNDNEFLDSKSSKVVKSILTASGKKSKNRRISWGGYNKQHCFNIEGHLYDVDVPMNENILSQLASEDSNTSRSLTFQKTQNQSEAPVEPKGNNVLGVSFSGGVPTGNPAKENNNQKNTGLSLTFSNAQQQEELHGSKAAGLVNPFESPQESPVKIKISDTPLLKPLNSSVFFEDNEDLLGQSGFLDIGSTKTLPTKALDVNKSFGLESSFMKDLFIRSEARTQNEPGAGNVQFGPPADVKGNKEEVKNKQPQPKPSAPTAPVDEKKSLFEPAKPEPAQNKRLSLSIKNILDEKSPDLSSYLPLETIRKPTSIISAFEKENKEKDSQALAQENVEIKRDKPKGNDEKGIIQRAQTDVKPSFYVPGLFGDEPAGQPKEKETNNMNFAQQINEEIQKNRRLSSTVHEILHVEYPPPSSIKKVEQSNFSLEQDDFISNLIKDKPLSALFQENDGAQPLTTTLILNQSFEDKLNKYMSPQKKTTMNPNIHLSKSPLLSSPKYGFESPNEPHTNPDTGKGLEEAAPADKRRLSLKMKFSDSDIFGDEEMAEVLKEDKEYRPVDKNMDSKASLNPYTFATELKTIPECSDSFGESDAKKSSLDAPPEMSSVQTSRQKQIQAIQDANRRISLKVSITDGDDESSQEEGEDPFGLGLIPRKVDNQGNRKASESDRGKQGANPPSRTEVTHKEKVDSTQQKTDTRKNDIDTTKTVQKNIGGIVEEKKRSPPVKRKEPSTGGSELEEITNLKLKKTKLNSVEAPSTKQVPEASTMADLRIASPPRRPKSVLKNARKADTAHGNPAVTRESTAAAVVQGDKTQGNLDGDKAKQGGDAVAEEAQYPQLTNLIVKSPRINKLQKRFLIDFLSPKDSSLVNQSIGEVNNPYALLEQAPIFKQSQESQGSEEEQSSFTNILKRSLLLKCKSCYEYAQKVKLLKEQVHDLDYNIGMLDSEIKVSEDEVEHKKAEIRRSDPNLMGDYAQTINYDKMKYALIENLQITLSLFGYSIKNSISNDKTAVFRIKFDNGIIGRACFEIKGSKGGEDEYYLSDLNLIDSETGYKKASKGQKVLAGEEVTFDRSDNKADPRNAFTRKNILDLVFNEMIKAFYKKTVKKPSSLFIFTSFRIRSYFYLLNTLRQLGTCQLIDKIVMNYDSLVVRVTFRFRYLPRSIMFSLNLQRSWWNDFEVLWENEKQNPGENQEENKPSKGSRQDERNMENKMWDSTKIKLKTLFNSEINKRNINKFENIVNDILSFKWITV